MRKDLEEVLRRTKDEYSYQQNEERKKYQKLLSDYNASEKEKQILEEHLVRERQPLGAGDRRQPEHLIILGADMQGALGTEAIDAHDDSSSRNEVSRRQDIGCASVTGMRAATVSTWWVMGNVSNARRCASRYPAEAKSDTSLARATGSQAT